MQAVSLNGRVLCTDGSIVIDYGYFHYKALNSLGYDIRFEEYPKNSDSEPLSTRVRVVAGSLDTKEKINQLDRYIIHDEKYTQKNPVRAHFPHSTPDSEILEKYVEVFSEILMDNPDLKPRTK